LSGYLICLNENFDCLGELTDYNITYMPENKIKKIETYPNPVKNVITINFNNNINYNSLEIIVYNIVGQTKKISDYSFIEDNKVQINTSNLNKGIYFLKIIFDNDSFITKKIIKI